MTTDAFRRVIDGVAGKIRHALRGLDPKRIDRLHAAARRCRELVEHAKLPPDLSRAVRAAYRRLSGKRDGVPVAVRSSAVGEDSAEASFAGQQDTYLNIRGEDGVLRSYRRCLGSLFTPRAISYRLGRGIDPAASEMAVVVQQLVRADLGGAGVAFTIDPESGHDEFLVINAIYGYGENLVQGKVNPDEYLLFKPNLINDKDPIIARRIGSKRLALSCAGRGGMRNRRVPRAQRVRPVLRYDEILAVARMSLRIEGHTKRPMDIEWVKDGETGRFYIVQARPETVHSRGGAAVHERTVVETDATPLVQGISVGEKAAGGVVRVVKDPTHPQGFREGDILVSEKTDPDWEPIMKRSAGIVTDRGGRTCHAAIVSRELGIPAVVGSETATRRLATGQEVTVSCAEGQVGFVYPGRIPIRVERISLEGLPRPRTKVMVNIGNPDISLKTGRLPCDGVGLARVEFIIANRIGVHPNALVDPTKLPDKVQRRVLARIADRPDGKEYFIQTLAEGVATIGAAFYPREVIVRLSDFKSDEYANLLGGRYFEPTEENPMLGLRGAARYIHPNFRPAFELECEALRRVRADYGLTNVKLMVPFCRTLREADEVLRILAAQGLRQGRMGLEVYVMCEIPSNVILAQEFAERFDGFSIGSNDLTQLALGVDRNAGHLSTLFDERNPAVKKLIAQVIATCKTAGRKVGICGQAPSDYPDFCRFLVECGIDSISLNPDQVVPMTRQILRFEAGGGRRKLRAGARWKAAGEAAWGEAKRQEETEKAISDKKR